VNSDRLKKVLKSKKLLTAMEKGSADHAVKVFYQLYAKASADCVEAMEDAYRALKAAEAQLIVKQFTEGSSTHKLLIKYANEVCQYYLESLENYAVRMDEPAPYTRKEFFYKFVSWARECPDTFSANKPWTLSNIANDKATEYALGLYHYWFYKLADPTPEVTRFGFEQFCKIFNSTEDFFSKEAQRAKLVLLTDRLADQFEIDRRDTEKLKKAVLLALNVAVKSYVKVNGDQETSDYLKFGYLVGRDMASTNTALQRIIKAVKDYEAKKQKEERVSVDPDELDLS